MEVELLRPDDLMDDMAFWQLDERFHTIEVHEHRCLLLGMGISRMSRGILCLSIRGSQPLVIDLKH